VQGVIDAKSQTLVQIVPTLNAAGKAFVFPAGTSHSIAVNPHNNHVFVPFVDQQCVSCVSERLRRRVRNAGRGRLGLLMTRGQCVDDLLSREGSRPTRRVGFAVQ